jgi:hypothetical protein
MVSACALRRGIGGLGLLAALSSCSGDAKNQSWPPLPGLFFTTTTMAPNGDSYDGPAVVERSVWVQDGRGITNHEEVTISGWITMVAR